jgi:hypothetical protein
LSWKKTHVGDEGLLAVVASGLISRLRHFHFIGDWTPEPRALDALDGLAALQAAPHLERFCLEYIYMEDQGAMAIANSAALSGVVHLDLHQNVIGGDGPSVGALPVRGSVAAST